MKTCPGSEISRLDYGLEQSSEAQHKHLTWKSKCWGLSQMMPLLLSCFLWHSTRTRSAVQSCLFRSEILRLDQRYPFRMEKSSLYCEEIYLWLPGTWENWEIAAISQFSQVPGKVYLVLLISSWWHLEIFTFVQSICIFSH